MKICCDLSTKWNFSDAVSIEKIKRLSSLQHLSVLHQEPTNMGNESLVLCGIIKTLMGIKSDELDCACSFSIDSDDHEHRSWGSGCCCTWNKEVVGLNPSGRWSFFLYVFSDLKNKFSLKNGCRIVANFFSIKFVTSYHITEVKQEGGKIVLEN